MRKLQRRAKAVLALVLVVSLTIGSSQVVYATSAQNKKSEAEKNLNDVNKKIDNLENKKEEIEGELDAKNEELVNLMVDVGILEKEIDQNEKQLKQVKKDLKTAQKNEKKQYQAMKKRIKFMYERGDSAVISSLLESKSMADMLNRVEYFNEVYDYDRNLLDNYEKTRKQVEDLKAQVEDEKKELETAKDDLKQQQKQLETAMANLRSQQANADTQIANAKNLASEYQKTITEQNKIIQQQQAAAAASRSSGGSSGGSGGTSKPNSNASVPGGNLNPPKTTNVSGSDVVNYSMQFVGCRSCPRCARIAVRPAGHPGGAAARARERAPGASRATPRHESAPWPARSSYRCTSRINFHQDAAIIPRSVPRGNRGTCVFPVQGVN